jgi:hypothetical protein
MAKLGTSVKGKTTIKGAPPVVLAAQADSYIKLTAPADLKQWEQDLLDYYGITMSATGLVGAATESCSNGCSDGCDLA